MNEPRKAPRPAEIPKGWRWLRTQGYSLSASATFAFRWMRNLAPPEGRVEVVRYHSRGTIVDRQVALGDQARTQRGRVTRVTRWEVAPPDRVTFHDEVRRKGHLEVLGEERFHFLGGDQPGCIVEVTVLRKPVSLVSRVGLILFPELSLRPTKEEAAIFDQIDRDYRRSTSGR